MAIVKGYCTNCNKNDEVRRIFDVNPDVRFCYCPHCGKKYRPRFAIANYQKVITKYVRKATFYLKNAGEPQLAYALYAYVLELEPTNLDAKIGRLLSLAYLSTVRRERFTEVLELLELTPELFRTHAFKDRYLIFLLALERCTVNYLIHLKKALTLKNCFFDTECIKLYYNHIKAMISLKRFIASEFSLLDAEDRAKEVNESIKEFEKEYKVTTITCDGQEHYFANFGRSGDPLITNGRYNSAYKLDKYRLSTLDARNKKLRLIKENIFTLRYHHMFKVFSTSFVYMALFGVVAIASFITYFSVRQYQNSIVFLVLGILASVGILTFLALRLIFGQMLKKPRI
ncbi:MAG: hypothetical protein IJK27_05930 [Bacilli bacterium]|nr:hypothetical protein [Bacilli bacterium]